MDIAFVKKEAGSMAYPRLTEVKDERDSCALVAIVTRDGRPSRRAAPEALEALSLMAHRSGQVGADGDGCGLQTDLPRALWAKRLAAAGMPESYAASPHFAVAHLVIPDDVSRETTLAAVLHHLEAAGCRVLLARPADVDAAALGPGAAAEQAVLWQVAVHGPGRGNILRRRLFDLHVRLEQLLPVHVASFSPDIVVYKVRGTPAVLQRYFHDLSHASFASRAVLGHNRYSTNTSTILPRVQPFSSLGHNGEINTIQKLREEAELLGVTLIDGASDSQDLNRVLEFMLFEKGFSLFEAMEALFPPIINEIKRYPAALQDLYVSLRQAWGPFAQGPAAILSRSGNECVFAVDALGLRPLWLLQTADHWVFASEQGVVSPELLEAEPKPLAPGEKVGLRLVPGGNTHLFPYESVQAEAARRFQQRQAVGPRARRFLSGGVPAPGDRSLQQGAAGSVTPTPPTPVPPAPVPFGGLSLKTSGTPLTAVADLQPYDEQALALSAELPSSWLAACGWDLDDVRMARHLASTGSEPVGSLGFDGPLAALSRQRHNLADYFKETVAVVTNPAIDREREIEHFSTRAVVGSRPQLGGPDTSPLHRVELRLPLLLGGSWQEAPLLHWSAQRALAARLGSVCLEDVTAYFEEVAGPRAVARLSLAMDATLGLAGTLDQLCRQAVSAAEQGAMLLVLDDGPALQDGLPVVDAHLALSTIDVALRDHHLQPGEPSLRRSVSLVLRSAALRNLHDLAFALGLGAEALNPYAIWAQVAERPDPAEREQALEKLVSGLEKGVEKVISTLGIHELRGYTRLLSSIGLHPQVAARFRIPNFFGELGSGRDLADWEEEALQRAEILRGRSPSALARTPRFSPLVWKMAGEVARGERPYSDFADRVAELEAESPVALRHLLGFRSDACAVARDGTADARLATAGVPAAEADTHAAVDTRAGRHAWPFFISAMSFGSQGEASFRAYVEAARRLNILCINGEGGELAELLGRYPHHRGQQVASGRFGVNSLLINSADLVEIKIGQGAKPGEGGHLPGSKVTAKVAQARHASPGVDLISPSNNHDLYSIEDLAQLITELKTANPAAKVSVKMPVVPGIGTIAVGVAKAGADVVSLSGYDGGTGAARLHALRHAGLPAEVGVMLAHEALVEAGLREQVEIWADGGMRTAADVVKMLCLGANRVGFATLAMMAIGCTVCRGCHLDTCHVGIATQVQSAKEARSRGLKRFEPRVVEEAVSHLYRLFEGMGREVAAITAGLGLSRTQDLVGRRDLLEQVREQARVDLRRLLRPTQAAKAAEPLARAPHGSVHVSRPSTPALAELVAGGKPARPNHRALGAELAGQMARHRLGFSHEAPPAPGGAQVLLRSVPGNGLAAFSLDGVDLRLTGGAQDGLAKSSCGGRVAVLKHRSRRGVWLGGSVGKSFAYGAQEGLFLVQGDADARAGIRLSGADLVIGGEVTRARQDSGNLGLHANIKGFAFEYMTAGRAVVLGDIGPWACSGMTGGVVYCRLHPALGLGEESLQYRLAKGAQVQIRPLGARGKRDLAELLGAYAEALENGGQHEAARRTLGYLDDPGLFRAIVPAAQPIDEEVSGQ